MNTHYDLIIIGLGPSGIAAALEASKISDYKILCIDQGLPISSRRINSLHGVSCKCHNQPRCDVLNGFGGSSLISGTKLSDFPAGSGLVKITGSSTRVQEKTAEALKLFNSFLSFDKSSNKSKNDQEIAKIYYAKHKYTHKYYTSYSFEEQKYLTMLENLYEQLSKRVEIRFSTKLLNLAIQDNSHYEIHLEETQLSRYKLSAEKVILATGKSGYETLSMLSKNLNLPTSDSHIEVGLRLEFPSHLFDEIDLHQDDLKLTSGQCRTYCVSKYGEVVGYSYKGKYFTEGRIRKSKKTSSTNLAILLRLPPSTENISIYNDIMDSYNNHGQGNIFRCNYLDFISHNSIAFKIFPEDIYTELHKEIQKFVTTFFPPNAFTQIQLYGIEQDFPIFSYNVDKHFAITQNLYIIGAATGLFRGIIQSFVSGIICIEDIKRSLNA